MPGSRGLRASARRGGRPVIREALTLGFVVAMISFALLIWAD